MFDTDIEKLRANLYIKTACSEELANELIDQEESAESDALIVGAMSNLGVDKQRIREMVRHCQHNKVNFVVTCFSLGLLSDSSVERVISEKDGLRHILNLDLNYRELEQRINQRAECQD